MIKLINTIDKILIYLAGASLLIMMFLIFINAVMRSFFGYPIRGVIEMTGEYFMVIIVYLSISYTQKYKGHVNVELLNKFMNKKIKTVLNIFTQFISGLMFLILAYVSFNSFLHYLDQNIRSISSLSYPLAPAVFLIFLGSLIMSIRLFLTMFNKPDSAANHPEE